LHPILKENVMITEINGYKCPVLPEKMLGKKNHNIMQRTVERLILN
jgi:hypothetical protein